MNHRSKLLLQHVIVLLLLAVSSVALTGQNSSARLPELSVHFIDIGQGSAVLLHHASAAILVDAGNHGHAFSYLQTQGVDHIDLAIASHAHADHIGGFTDIFSGMTVGALWYNGQTHTTQTFERFIDAVLASDTAYTEPVRGHSASFGELSITVLHPATSAAEYTGHLHDKNMVIRADYGDISFLLPGDAEVSAERAIRTHGANVAATVLKLGHHGSRTSSSADFLAAVHPSVVVYQASQGNAYGQPHNEVLSRVDRLLGVPVYGSDVHGTVIITTDGVDVTVRTELFGNDVE